MYGIGWSLFDWHARQVVTHAAAVHVASCSRKMPGPPCIPGRIVSRLVLLRVLPTYHGTAQAGIRTISSLVAADLPLHTGFNLIQCMILPSSTWYLVYLV